MSDIKIETHGHILTIGWNRPEKMNAFTRDMYFDIAKALGELESNPDLRVAVIYGVGDHFTSGLQLDDWAATFHNGGLPPLEEGLIDPFGLSGPMLSKPVLMAVQGYCYTCGVELLINTDVRVAADNTRFAQLEVKRGFHACGGATFRLPTEMGWSNAQRYLLTGDEWTADQALSWGMVQAVVPAGQQFDKAMEYAERIAKAAPLGVQGSLLSSKKVRYQQEVEVKKTLFSDLKPILQSQDMQEGLQSFLERREANFKGK